MGEPLTIRSFFVGTRPQTPLCDVLGVKAPYTSEIVSGAHPGRRLTARIIARILIPKYGRRKAADILLATYENRFPDEFTSPPVDSDALKKIQPDSSAA